MVSDQSCSPAGCIRHQAPQPAVLASLAAQCAHSAREVRPVPPQSSAASSIRSNAAASIPPGNFPVNLGAGSPLEQQTDALSANLEMRLGVSTCNVSAIKCAPKISSSEVRGTLEVGATAAPSGFRKTVAAFAPA